VLHKQVQHTSSTQKHHSPISISSKAVISLHAMSCWPRLIHSNHPVPSLSHYTSMQSVPQERAFVCLQPLVGAQERQQGGAAVLELP
jgi:hypothetical protein